MRKGARDGWTMIMTTRLSIRTSNVARHQIDGPMETSMVSWEGLNGNMSGSNSRTE